jgi:lipopolysaccharide export LptBFGC system permease protein LptF
LFVLAEYIAPDALERARFLYEVRIKGENQFVFTSNDEIFRKGEGNRFYIMANFDGARKVMTRPTILDRNPAKNSLAQRIEADRAVYIEGGEGGEHFWEFQGTQRWTFQDDGTVKIEKFTVPLRIKMEENLESFLSREKRPAEMRPSVLSDYCAILERQGGGPQLARYRTSLHGKFSLPFACLLLSLIGFAVAADLHVRRFVLAFSAGLVFGIVYYLLREALLGMGKRDLIPPLVAAWASVGVFGLLATGLLYRLGTVH